MLRTKVNDNVVLVSSFAGRNAASNGGPLRLVWCYRGETGRSNTEPLCGRWAHVRVRAGLAYQCRE